MSGHRLLVCQPFLCAMAANQLMLSCALNVEEQRGDLQSLRTWCPSNHMNVSHTTFNVFLLKKIDKTARLYYRCGDILKRISYLLIINFLLMYRPSTTRDLILSMSPDFSGSRTLHLPPVLRGEVLK